MPRGRPAKSTAEKRASGNPGRRPLNDDDLVIPTAIPKPPTFLKGEALKEWKRVTKELEKLGMISVLDMAAVASYCSYYGRWVTAEKGIAKHGVVGQGSQGQVVVSPYVIVADRCQEGMRKIISELGLAPGPRSRMKIKPPETPTGDKSKNFLFRPTPAG